MKPSALAASLVILCATQGGCILSRYTLYGTDLHIAGCVVADNNAPLADVAVVLVDTGLAGTGKVIDVGVTDAAGRIDTTVFYKWCRHEGPLRPIRSLGGKGTLGSFTLSFEREGYEAVSLRFMLDECPDDQYGKRFADFGTIIMARM